MTVDLAIFTIRDDHLHVLLIERGKEPYIGRRALPGGHIRGSEALDGAARRELREETGIDGLHSHLEQMRTYGDPDRDPRGRYVTVAYLALVPDLPVPVAGTDARRAHWVPVDKALADTPGLAFDHEVILRDALEQTRSRLEYTTVATAFCPEPFTVSDLRHVYEVVWGVPLDPSNFRRKVTRAEGFLEATGGRRVSDTGRPAALYRRGPARTLIPPLMRSAEVGATGIEWSPVAADA
ncbi:NUDIX hydrolase [Marinitenerispora sediminis]|uniref:NUDIX hydrolase n=1 Tax=Marinitenerispora sediminis TaxID=1931232 RepID=A0A368T086_9ACTN|nr:NUDIX domain-containing protein [Marinitenerispora sediminis]RCV50992.1 NUDIX hydrolase [Marinitenerispora sediminis]RCV52486.1 NUDIX hydrolase [Marinitenerispora sediminis]RCV53837.1 NUDIX hydrolase [Marinitenerispora sediminis]